MKKLSESLFGIIGLFAAFAFIAYVKQQSAYKPPSSFSSYSVKNLSATDQYLTSQPVWYCKNDPKINPNLVESNEDEGFAVITSKNTFYSSGKYNVKSDISLKRGNEYFSLTHQSNGEWLTSPVNSEVFNLTTHNQDRKILDISTVNISNSDKEEITEGFTSLIMEEKGKTYTSRIIILDQNSFLLESKNDDTTPEYYYSPHYPDLTTQLDRNATYDYCSATP